MIRKTGFLLLMFLCSGFAGMAQKVKYKDLFLLLNAKEYQKAEPFLKRYLKDNDDNPNAFLFMGIVYQDKASKIDVLKQPEAVRSVIDSSLIFYAKALATITEKEIKRNDEYYEAYKRRDLRTAEFGIKLSDIQFDLDKRVQGLKEKKDRIRQLKQYFVDAETAYQRANLRYKKIQEAYATEKEFYLRSDESTVTSLKLIISAFDSCTTAFSNYKSTSQIIGKTGYNQVLDLKEIKDFKKDGTNLSDFYKDDLKLWDYKKWASAAEENFVKELFPLRDGLVSTDNDLNKLGAKQKKDSLSVDKDLKAILGRPGLAQLKKYDANPLPLEVFHLKAAEMEYNEAIIAARKQKDSLNLTLRLQSIKKQYIKASALDSLSALLVAKDLTEEIENYKHFVANAYGTPDVLKNLIKTTNTFAAAEKSKKQREEEAGQKSLKWIVVAPDSIPLFVEQIPKTIKFHPLSIVADDHTLGIKYVDSLATGYFYTITPSRIPDIKVSFPVPAVGFNKRNLPILKALSTKDEKGQVYFALIYSESKTKDKFTVVIAKIYKTDGLAWSRTFPMEMIPASLTYNGDSSELSVKITDPGGSSKIVVIDKAGKQIQ